MHYQVLVKPICWQGQIGISEEGMTVSNAAIVSVL